MGLNPLLTQLATFSCLYMTTFSTKAKTSTVTRPATWTIGYAVCLFAIAAEYREGGADLCFGSNIGFTLPQLPCIFKSKATLY